MSGKQPKLKDGPEDPRESKYIIIVRTFPLELWNLKEQSLGFTALPQRDLTITTLLIDRSSDEESTHAPRCLSHLAHQCLLDLQQFFSIL